MKHFVRTGVGIIIYLFIYYNFTSYAESQSKDFSINITLNENLNEVSDIGNGYFIHSQYEDGKSYISLTLLKEGKSLAQRNVNSKYSAPQLAFTDFIRDSTKEIFVKVHNGGTGLSIKNIVIFSIINDSLYKELSFEISRRECPPEDIDLIDVTTSSFVSSCNIEVHRTIGLKNNIGETKIFDIIRYKFSKNEKWIIKSSPFFVDERIMYLKAEETKLK